MQNLHNPSHPCLRDMVARLRDMEQNASQFSATVAAIALYLFYEANDSTALTAKTVRTWQGDAGFDYLPQEEIAFIPILRAAMPMLSRLNEFYPEAVTGFLAMKRDETSLQPQLLYDRVPDLEGKRAYILDPMVATGGSLDDAIGFVKTKNPKKIICLNIIAYDKNYAKLSQKHPEVEFFAAQLDEKLNENGFILPGIGDAGDRAYNTPW